jgi:cytidyltransferase-like protein
MMALLSSVTALLEYSDIPYWITQGTLLGAMRGGKLIQWTNDVDISVLYEDFPRILSLLRNVTQQKTDSISAEDYVNRNWQFMHYTYYTNTVDENKVDEETPNWRWLAIASGVTGVHLDINGRTPSLDGIVFKEQCNKDLYPESCSQPQSQEHRIRLSDVFPLTDIMLQGMVFWGPRLPSRVLEKYYGTNWKIPDRYGEGDWISNDDIHSVQVPVQMDSMEEQLSTTAPNPVPVSVPVPVPVSVPVVTTVWNDHPFRVYVDVVGDMFHFGHVRLFERARKLGKTLVVGVHDDNTVESYKRRPILTMQERINVIRSCKWVDEIIPNAPLILTAEYMDMHRIDLVVRGDDQLPETARSSYGVAMDR